MLRFYSDGTRNGHEDTASRSRSACHEPAPKSLPRLSRQPIRRAARLLLLPEAISSSSLPLSTQYSALFGGTQHFFHHSPSSEGVNLAEERVSCGGMQVSYRKVAAPFLSHGQGRFNSQDFRLSSFFLTASPCITPQCLRTYQKTS